MLQCGKIRFFAKVVTGSSTMGTFGQVKGQRQHKNHRDTQGRLTKTLAVQYGSGRI